MAEYQGNKEDKFDFTREGEVPGYISLDQARVLAMRTARETPGAYGSRYAGVPMAFEVAQAEETEDHYVITMSFRPQGEFDGSRGQEQFFIEKEGTVAHRQVLALPRRRRPFPVLPVGIGIVVAVAAVAVGAVFVVGGLATGRGEDAGSASVLPTDTPVPPTEVPVQPPANATAASAAPTTIPASTVAPTDAPPPAPTVTNTPAPTATLPPTATPTPRPTATPRPRPTPTPTPRRIPHPYGRSVLGVSGNSVTPELASKEGLLVTSGLLVAAEPVPGSAAASIGLTTLDVITRINDQDVSTNERWDMLFSSLQPGETVRVTFVRGSTRFDRDVTLGAYYDTGQIAAGTDHRLNYFLEPGQTMEFYFIEDGGLDIGFNILDPDGKPAMPASREMSLDGELRALKSGAYQVIFDNTYSIYAGKRIHWYYRILP